MPRPPETMKKMSGKIPTKSDNHAHVGKTGFLRKNVETAQAKQMTNAATDALITRRVTESEAKSCVTHHILTESAF